MKFQSQMRQQKIFCTGNIFWIEQLMNWIWKKSSAAFKIIKCYNQPHFDQQHEGKVVLTCCQSLKSYSHLIKIWNCFWPIETNRFFFDKMANIFNFLLLIEFFDSLIFPKIEWNSQPKLIELFLPCFILFIYKILLIYRNNSLKFSGT